MGKVKLLADFPERPLSLLDALDLPPGQAILPLYWSQVIGVTLSHSLQKSWIAQQFNCLRLGGL